MAALVSLWAIRENRKIARKRATIDLIERFESSPFYQDLLSEFSEVRLGGTFDTLFELKDKIRKDQRKRILAFLNHYELIALGIEQGILDESFYRAYMHSVVVRDWDAAAPFIEHLRQPTPDSAVGAAFVKFQALVDRWR